VSNAETHLDFDSCYRAVDSRDGRFDGWFVTCVTSTGIYCRPSCPAMTPKRTNVRFLPSAAAAQRDGFRACLRCRPDAAPGSPDWNYRADVVGRAMRLISDGVVDRAGVPGLASRLGYTERHLNRLLQAEVGAGPLALARAQRAQTSRVLIETTGLGLAEIAFAAGFGSIRQFNDTVREIYSRTPSQLRTAARAGTGSPGGPGAITLRLPFREPLHAGALMEFFSHRSIPGLDEVVDGRYRRGLRLPHGSAVAEIDFRPGYALTTLRLADLRDLAPAVARCRRLLDLDADPVAVDTLLAADPVLAESVAKEPGIRIPGAVDGFETVVRAIIGQQISVVGAGKVLARLLAGTTSTDGEGTHGSDTDRDGTYGHGTYGSGTDGHGTYRHGTDGHGTDGHGTDARTASGSATIAGPNGGRADGADTYRPDADGFRPSRLRGFPTPQQVAEAPDSAFGMPVARRRTLRMLAEQVAAGSLRLDPGADRAETESALLAIPGIGPWTAQYVAMRALGDPDIMLATDLGARRGGAKLGLPDAARLIEHAKEHWSPWRSYATMRLWRIQ
jgi:AraC family transcriptional regulator of adaptative response / DNA-3-methyladenine glycosylase II